MERPRRPGSPSRIAIADHYASGYEAERLEIEVGKLERERSRELLQRFLPPPPATVLDVGGGPGGHACWLARLGYRVHLVDILALHLEMARKASTEQPETPLLSIAICDARSLAWADEEADAVLLLGPLYHLTAREDRVRALREAYRVLRRGGLLLAVAISRFASTLDGLRTGCLTDPTFAAIVERDLQDGQHRSPTDRPDYFMDTFFHHPEELRSEVAEGGFNLVGVYGVEGPGWLAKDFDAWWKDEVLRQRLLSIARTLETEPSVLGISAHLLAVGLKA